MFVNSNTSLSMYLFYNLRIHVITLYSGHVCVYYVSMFRCWHLIWILVRTDHPCFGVGCHSFWGQHLRTRCCPCIIERFAFTLKFNSRCKLWCIKFETLICNILIVRSFKFSLYVCALVYSFFIKNLSAWSWPLTHLIRWGVIDVTIDNWWMMCTSYISREWTLSGSW
jgi:hypothetical protein